MNYFELNENKGWELLEKWNEETHYFKSLTRANEKQHFDASGVTKDNQRFVIEIKIRNVQLTRKGNFSGKTFIDNTLFIESHKMSDLLLDKIDGFNAFYINFLENGVVVAYNLNNLTIRPHTQKKVIKSNGYNAMEMGFRQGLHLTDALVYKNNQLVKKNGEEWKTRTNS